MTENKFAKMLQTARENQATDQEQELSPQPRRPRNTVSIRAATKGRGRPATGKRSDPNYESTTVFLRSATKAAAARLLLDDKEQDLSGVLEKLLSEWVRRHS